MRPDACAGSHHRPLALIAIWLAGFSGCITATATGWYRYHTDDFSAWKNVRRVAIAPPRIKVSAERQKEIDDGLPREALPLYERFVSDELRAMGFEVVSSSAYGEAYRDFVKTFGGTIDHLGTISGLDRQGELSLRGSLFSHLRVTLGAQVVLFPVLAQEPVVPVADPRLCDGQPVDTRTQRMMRWPRAEDPDVVPGWVLELTILDLSDLNRPLWESACLLCYSFALEPGLLAWKHASRDPALLNPATAGIAAKYSVASLNRVVQK